MQTGRHQKFWLLAFIVMFLSFSGARAESGGGTQFSAKVQVSVSAEEAIRGQVESYVKRELRSLRDVTIVDEGADWELSILAMEVSTKGGYKSGVIISAVILRPFDNQMVSALLEEKYKETGAHLTEGLYRYPDHWLRTGSTDQLRSLCVEIVADFDSQHLEKSRKLYREVRRILESNRSRK